MDNWTLAICDTQIRKVAQIYGVVAINALFTLQLESKSREAKAINQAASNHILSLPIKFMIENEYYCCNTWQNTLTFGMDS